MMFTRWKLLTGALGLSVGSWATFGNTADKQVDVPPPPVVAPVAAPITVASAPPVVPSLPAIPATAPVAPPAAPPASPLIELPGLPLPESKPTETKAPTPPKSVKPESLPVVPAGNFAIPNAPGDLVPLPQVNQAVGRAETVAAPAAPSTPSSLPPMPKPAVDAIGPGPAAPPATPSTIAKPTPTPEASLPVVEYTKPATPPTAPVATPLATPSATAPSVSPPAVTTPQPTVPVSTIPSKFRIVLRVGGENPSFEVRHDDDLVMKVVCEKVDIKSPDKGQGPSNVIATGKVRFVGFGAEGTCESLSFLAGTGEVSLTGNVNVKVRDKIGRVESELNADKMQYKLDQTALTGVLKP